MKLIDLSHMIFSKMPVYPGDDDVHVRQTKYFNKDGYSNFTIESGMHVGTHVDGPMHLTKSIQKLSGIDLSQFCGSGCLIDVRGLEMIHLTDQIINQVKKEDIILFYTGFDEFYGSEYYYQKHPILSIELTQFLIKQKMKMIGIDCPSPDHYPFKTHQLLLENQILIIENLTNLNQLLDQQFEVYAFPIKIEADSSMVRAVAKII